METINKVCIYGPFIGCTNYNKDGSGCGYSHAIGSDEDNKELSGDGKEIGIHPETKTKFFLKLEDMEDI